MPVICSFPARLCKWIEPVGWGELANPNTGVSEGGYVEVRTDPPNLRPCLLLAIEKSSQENPVIRWRLTQ
uniref:Uncharacterized protein n=1 Tax=Candidatus Kentrum sp. LPFa TaxID=2126335 RepID=A0A450VUM9_9GAMM|nr:MAG: hypothetical protein BECKLPF1236A_GA0070988_1001731 [Candidatus Kentron sp. LPFa]VFK24732.1 MAG: hypothetical protein BECKLPF1236C_GA0070990_1001532 [Candidatus Kentron sp. LPFa]